MDKRENIFDYFAQILMIFGVTIVCMNIFCALFGEAAKGYSTMFELGNQGLTVSTMLQFLGVSAAIITFKFIFFTDMLIKKMSIAIRTVCMFACVLTTLVICIWAFEWFPLEDTVAWLMFAGCFIVSVALSTLISVLYERAENKKMEEALRKLKN